MRVLTHEYLFVYAKGGLNLAPRRR
jgi:hypothetical protein